MKTFQFYEMGARLIMVEFEDQRDKDRVIREKLWNFDKSLILLKEFDGEQQVKHMHYRSIILDLGLWSLIYGM